jgi:hypothetical protein
MPEAECAARAKRHTDGTSRDDRPAPSEKGQNSQKRRELRQDLRAVRGRLQGRSFLSMAECERHTVKKTMRVILIAAILLGVSTVTRSASETDTQAEGIGMTQLVELTRPGYGDYRDYLYSSTYPAEDDGMRGRKPMDRDTLVVVGYGVMKDKDNVYYESQANSAMADGWFLVEGADAASFAYVGAKGIDDEAFYKDKNRIYRKSGSHAISVVRGLNLDTATFVYLGGDFYQDKNSVFRHTENHALELERMEGADAGSFEIINEIFAKDKSAIFIKGKKIKNSDPSTFARIDGKYYRDSRLVYFLKEDSAIVFGVDAGSFVVVDDRFVRDKAHVYDKESGEAITEFANIAHPASFERLLIPNATERTLSLYKDKAHVYVYDKQDGFTKLDADAQTFAILSCERHEYRRYGSISHVDYLYIRDRKNVYFVDSSGAKKILNTDPATFEPLGAFSKDKNRIYHEGKHTDGIDHETFTRAGEYHMDKNHLYVGSARFQIKGFDMSRFRALMYPYHIYDDQVYHHDGGGMRAIENADAKTFAVLEYGYAKDKNRVYHDGATVLQGAHPASFEVFDMYWSKDRNFVYRRDGDKILRPRFDAASFQKIGDSKYVKDKNGVYGAYVKTATVTEKPTKDPATFVLLNETYAKDKNHVYFDGSVVEGADAASFAAIDEFWGKDKNHVYDRVWIAQHMDAGTFGKTDDGQLRDKNAIYSGKRRGEVIEVLQ